MNMPNTQQTVDIETVRAGLSRVRLVTIVTALPWIAIMLMLLLPDNRAWRWFDWLFATMFLLLAYLEVVGHIRQRRTDLLRLSGPPESLLAYYRGRLRVAVTAPMFSRSKVMGLWCAAILLFGIGGFGEHDGFSKSLTALPWIIPVPVVLVSMWYGRSLGRQLQAELNILPPSSPPSQELSNRVQALLADHIQNGLNQNMPKETALTDEESKAVTGIDRIQEERLAAASRKISECLMGGEKIQAIKLWREETDDGLAEAKAAIEKLLDERAVPAAPPGGAAQPSTS